MPLQLTKFHQIGARVDDFDATRRFYEETLGATHIKTFDPPGLMFFEFSGVRLLFERGNKPATLYFWVDDLDASYTELLQKGISFDLAPHLIHKDNEGAFGETGQEEWMAFFKDPSGNVLALASRK